MHYVIMPFLDCALLTQRAIEDVLNQSLPCTLLLIDNGSQEEAREVGRTAASAHSDRVLLWHHDPPLPSLSATWNRALQFVWEAGGDHAWVVNNDLRVWEGTYAYLLAVQQATDALFVTATGVTPDQYYGWLNDGPRNGLSGPHPMAEAPTYPLPGPDFSCYLITKECHTKYPFDEGYIPAYCEDLDYHRRLMLEGYGARIFGTGLPFEHIGSGTLNDSPKARLRLERLITQGSRAHHLAKWGGGANQERFTVPFQETSAQDGVTTGELFERVRNGKPAVDEDY